MTSKPKKGSAVLEMGNSKVLRIGRAFLSILIYSSADESL